MLVLSRRVEESIIIGNDIVITVLTIRGDKVRLGISAPQKTPVHRAEVAEAIHAERVANGQNPAPLPPLRRKHA